MSEEDLRVLALRRAFLKRRYQAMVEAERSTELRKFVIDNFGPFAFAFAMRRGLGELILAAHFSDALPPCVRGVPGREGMPPTRGELLFFALEYSRPRLAHRLAEECGLSKKAVLRSRDFVSCDDLRTPKGSILQRACEKGDVSIVSWLISAFSIGPADLQANPHFLRAALNSGNQLFFRWLAEVARPSPAFLAEKVLARAGKKASLETFSWAAERFAVSREELLKPESKLMWRLCREGRLDIVKWLAERRGLAREDILATSGLLAACWADEGELLDYLLERFALTGQDIKDNAGSLLSADARQRLDFWITHCLRDDRRAAGQSKGAMRPDMDDLPACEAMYEGGPANRNISPPRVE